MLALYDSLSREKRNFAPADPNRVTMYVCGPTVYDHAHIGNFRAAVVFDLLYRTLRRHYGEAHVVYARNVTDIDDKIMRAASESGEPIVTITEKYARIYREESRALNILPPTLEPAATSHVGEMVAIISLLVEKGFAYPAEGHVLFAVEKFSGYGRLSGVDRDEMIAGARVEVAPYKQSPADFVLWKPSADGEPGWDSPWGRGRPGWHIECSAMIAKALGVTIDIHGGGQDLRFPHHENEIAQSVCAHDGAPLARFWVHNGFLRMGANKMSKSLGNVALLRDLLKQHKGETLRFALLSAHYRQPLEWTDRLLDQSKAQLDKFYRLLLEAPDPPAVAAPHSVALALDDDMNTPEAIAGLHELRDIAIQMQGEARRRAIASLKAAGAMMGLFGVDPAEWFKSPGAGHKIVQVISEGVEARETHAALQPTAIEALIAARAAAKKAKNFAEADRIRDDLAAQGIILEDRPDGTTDWRRG